MPKTDLVEKGVGAIHYGQIYTHYGAWATETISFVSPATASRLASADPGDIIITNTSENLEDVGKAVAWLGEQSIVTGGHATIIKHREDPRFLAYWFQSSAFFTQKKALATGTKVIDVSARQLAKVQVPVPPLDVQREIATVLDQLAGFEAELAAGIGAELAYRQTQYAYYRDLLLSSENANCKWLTFREAAIEFGRGKSRHRPRNDPKLYGGRYPFIQTGDIRSSGHLITEHSQTYNDEGLAQSKLWPRGTVCITIAANIAESGILDFDSCFPDSVIGMVVDPEKSSPHFVEYLLQSLKVSLAKKGRGSAQANINLATFESERFPFPPIEEQKRIVSILDRLDGLIDELSTALQAERGARRHQYQHYLDRLFTFKELSV